MEAFVGGDRPCRDPECDGVAEAEVDGGYRYFECGACGFVFGYERVELSDDVCGLGVPEDVRRVASIEPGKRVIPLTVK